VIFINGKNQGDAKVSMVHSWNFLSLPISLIYQDETLRNSYFWLSHHSASSPWLEKKSTESPKSSIES
jgi:hypothetical protein